MPRSAIVVSTDPALFSNVRVDLGSDTRFIDTGDNLHCDGVAAPLTNIYPVETIPAEWDDWTGSAGALPDPRIMSRLIFECRSPEWVAEVVDPVAQRLESPVWIIDAADKAWPAGQIDPARIAPS